MGINNWPIDEQPREKLLQRGAAALTDAELLAIFLRTGVKGRSAVDLARDLLTEHGSLQQLLAADRERFCASHGLGNAKYAQLQAVLEMSQRHLREHLDRGDALSSPQQTSDYLQSRLAGQRQELFVCLFLDNRHRLIEYQELFRGTIDGASVYPREVVREAIRHNAAALIIAHNHPSGVAEPSQADVAITERLKQALQLIDVRLLDHLIVGAGVTTSLAERGLM